MAHFTWEFYLKIEKTHLIIAAIYLEFFFLLQIFNSKEVVAVAFVLCLRKGPPLTFSKKSLDEGFGKLLMYSQQNQTSDGKRAASQNKCDNENWICLLYMFIPLPSAILLSENVKKHVTSMVSSILEPIVSIYGIFTYIYHKYQL